MEEPTNDTVASAHKRSKILFNATLSGVISLFLATGGILIATGRLMDSLSTGEKNDANLMGLSR